ncbi:hypothetical protein OIU81_35200 [Streptomyces sp. NBC_01454]|nr:hypothetical protein [Streptomyces sp. NBC_01454]
MQITGETLERAMAVLEGHASSSAPSPDPEPDTRAGATGDREANEAGPRTDASDGSDGSDGSDAMENVPRRDEKRKPQRRGHLRGL